MIGSSSPDAASAVTFEALRFDQISGRLMHQILMLRAEVFVVEQKCFYQDPDTIDLVATHLLGWRNDELVAYARWWEEKPWIRLGRILTSPAVRGQGIGRALIKECLGLIGTKAVLIFAQTHLRSLYEEFSFVAVGDSFMEDGIPHLRMERGEISQ